MRCPISTVVQELLMVGRFDRYYQSAQAPDEDLG